MVLSVCFMASVNLTILTVLSEVIVPFGYSDSDAAVFGFWINLLGNFGGVASSIIIGKTGKFKYVTVALILLTAITCLIFQFCVVYISPTNGYWPVFISLNFLCFFNMGIYSYCMEYAVKLAPQIGESLSGGTII